MIKQIVVGSVVFLGSSLLVGCGVNGNLTATPTGNGTYQVNGTVHTSGTPSKRSTTASRSTPASPSLSYVTYHNRIWGYSLSVPQTFIASASPEDGGGLSWSSGSVNIVVYGQYSNATGHTLTVASVLRTMDNQKHPSYQVHGSNWLVVSGTHGSQIYYIKEFIGSTKTDVLSISYPVADKNHWQSMVSAVSLSFKPGSLGSSSSKGVPIFSSTDLEGMYAVLLCRFVGPIIPPSIFERHTQKWAPRVSLAMLAAVPASERPLDRSLIAAIIRMRAMLQPAGEGQTGHEIKTLLTHLPFFQQRQYSTPAGGGRYWWPVNNHWPQWVPPDTA